MAKKISRAQRKKQREKEINKKKNYLVKQGKISKKSTLSQSEIERQYSKIISQNQAKNKAKNKAKEKYKKAVELQTWKFHQLVAMGFEPESLKSTYLRKIKKKDILNNNVTRENYPFLFDSFWFDFNKRYYFPDGLGWFIMFQDYSGENTLEELMLKFDKYSNETLITFLEGIINTPKIHDPRVKDSGSSGRAGRFRSYVYDEEVAQDTLMSLNNDLLEKYNSVKKRYHSTTSFWQTLMENGKYTVKSITGRETLIILNALLYNVTEDDRDYYRGTYKTLTHYIPDFKEILPKP